MSYLYSVRQPYKFFFHEKFIFFKLENRKILLFLGEHNTIKMDIIRFWY